jgi:hypothetical protein
MKVWIIQAGGRYDGIEIARERVGDVASRDCTFRPQVFADTEDGYRAALLAFGVMVGERIGKGKAVYSYPGQLGINVRAHIVARDGFGDDWNDVVELEPFEVIGG